ncbi:MAG: hypothetical protein WDZ50_04935 [Woeseia sp.]
MYSLILILLTTLLSACGKSQPGSETGNSSRDIDRLTAANLGEQLVLPTDDYLRLPQYRNADLVRGERLVMQCRACHSFEQGGQNIIGPNLHGFFGRRVASVVGYPYSPTLSQADFIWTPQALDAWLAEPTGFLPGNRMVYGGLRSADDRHAAIAALLRLTTNSNASTQR